MYRNHYESIVRINPEIIFSLAQTIALRTENKCEMNPNDIISVQN